MPFSRSSARARWGRCTRARDPQLSTIAIKVLAAHGDVDARLRGSRARRAINLREPDAERDDLLHEARIMARLAHPNVVPVYEVGYDGANVFVVIKTSGRGSGCGSRRRDDPEQVSDVFTQAARGLGAAPRGEHRAPRLQTRGDLLIGLDGRARVADSVCPSWSRRSVGSPPVPRGRWRHAEVHGARAARRRAGDGEIGPSMRTRPRCAGGARPWLVQEGVRELVVAGRARTGR